MGKKKEKIVGRSEVVGFPELGLAEVSAKVDTGAYGSTIHCDETKISDDDRLQVKFSAEEYQLEEDSVVEFDEYSRKSVVSSNGQREERWVVETTIELGDKIRDITLSLTNRERLRNPVLIGRLFLKKQNLLVNPKKKNALTRRKDT